MHPAIVVNTRWAGQVDKRKSLAGWKNPYGMAEHALKACGKNVSYGVGKQREAENVWYVVWIRTGQEEEVLRLCRKKITDKEVLEECFLPKYEKAWKENGKWGKRERILFPGYLFIITDHIDKLFWELKKIPEITKILGDGERPVPLYQHEIDFLKKYTNQEHVLEMSTGDLIGGELVVTDGPLKDYKGKVVRIDRKKREATLEMEFFGRTTTMKVGLEVVRKV